jgi:hypothetical protein
MEILKNVITVTLEDGETQLKRIEYITGVIDWVVISTQKEYKIENGIWSVFDPMAWKYLPLTENIPTWEQEYQELLLAQHPFEKRVREVAEKNDRAGEVCFDLNRDYAFNQLLKEYLGKQPIKP